MANYYAEYQHQVVRDLAWAIASAPLMTPGDSQCHWYSAEWYQHLYGASVSWLRQLDKQPESLQARVDQQKDRRMGKYFETLWAFWLEQDPRFEVLQQNLALRLAGNTLGELDFLVLDKTTGKCLHWEMAVKFYLGVGDTRLQKNWHGPGKKDRLDKKVEHLQNRQSVLSRLPAAREILADMGWQVDECGVIMKGRLYYGTGILRPVLHPVDADQGHNKGEWLSISGFREHYAENDSFYPLPGEGWMAQSIHSDAAAYMNKNNVLEAISGGLYRLPLHLEHCQETASSGRIFLVSDDWSSGL